MKKTLLSLGNLGASAAPMATKVACGDDGSKNINTWAYDLIKVDVANKTITVTGLKPDHEAAKITKDFEKAHPNSTKAETLTFYKPYHQFSIMKLSYIKKLLITLKIEIK